MKFYKQNVAICKNKMLIKDIVILFFLLTVAVAYSGRNSEQHRRNLKLSRNVGENHHIASRDTVVSKPPNKSHLKKAKFLGIGDESVTRIFNNSGVRKGLRPFKIIVKQIKEIEKVYLEGGTEVSEIEEIIDQEVFTTSASSEEVDTNPPVKGVARPFYPPPNQSAPPKPYLTPTSYKNVANPNPYPYSATNSNSYRNSASNQNAYSNFAANPNPYHNSAANPNPYPNPAANSNIYSNSAVYPHPYINTAYYPNPYPNSAAFSNPYSNYAAHSYSYPPSAANSNSYSNSAAVNPNANFFHQATPWNGISQHKSSNSLPLPNTNVYFKENALRNQNDGNISSYANKLKSNQDYKGINSVDPKISKFVYQNSGIPTDHSSSSSKVPKENFKEIHKSYDTLTSTLPATSTFPITSTLPTPSDLPTSMENSSEVDKKEYEQAETIRQETKSLMKDIKKIIIEDEASDNDSNETTSSIDDSELAGILKKLSSNVQKRHLEITTEFLENSTTEDLDAILEDQTVQYGSLYSKRNIDESSAENGDEDGARQDYQSDITESDQIGNEITAAEPLNYY